MFVLDRNKEFCPGRFSFTPVKRRKYVPFNKTMVKLKTPKKTI